jgi:predicted transcriptional regulator
MAKAQLDYAKIHQLRDSGWTMQQIADELGTTVGAVSKVCKKMGIEIAKGAVVEAPKYRRRVDRLQREFEKNLDKIREEIDFLESKAPSASKYDDFIRWRDQVLKCSAEIRKTLSAIADYQYKTHTVQDLLRLFEILLSKVKEDCGTRGNFTLLESIEQEISIRQHMRSAAQ